MKTRPSEYQIALGASTAKSIGLGADKRKRLGGAGRLCIGLLIIGALAGCETYGDYDYGGPGWYGSDCYDYGGPYYYGGVWGPDVYVFGHHDHGGHDRD